MYLVRDIPAFVMYCVNGESGSSLLIESTDSMISKYCKWGNKCAAKWKAYFNNYTLNWEINMQLNDEF